MWGLRVAALGIGLIALARPQLGERETELARTGRDVLVLLDLSRSMLVRDAGGARLDAAKQVVWETMARFPGDRVGLVVFGGSAFLQLPLTSDRGAFRLFLQSATPDDLGDPATDLSAALRTAARTFEHQGESGRRAILVASDGESGEGDLETALAELRAPGIPVFAIGVGTAAGGPVPADSSEAPERFHRDNIGRIVISRLAEADLRRAAKATGGEFARWNRTEEMRRLVAGLATVRSATLSKAKARERADQFQWPLGLAVLVLMVELALNAGVGSWRRPLRGEFRPLRGATLVPGLLAAVGALSCSAAWRGERLYQDGKYGEASRIFHRALARDSTPRLAFDAGSALYRLERYEEAATHFRSASQAAGLRQRSLYNLGTALVRAAEEKPTDPEPLRRAVEAYEEALRLDPRDADAKWNLELALRRLGDDRTSGGSAGRGRNADYGQGNMNVPGYEGNPDAAVGAMAGGGFGSAEGESVEELSAEQARRLLDAVQRQQLTSHEGRRSPGSPRGDRDW